MKRALAFLFATATVGLAAWMVFPRSRPPEPAQSPAAASSAPAAAKPSPDAKGLHEARWYTSLADGEVHCQLCPNSCRLSDGQIGRCRARQNIGGKLYSLVYGKVAALHVDPIEKKPFFHVLPGKRAFSIGTTGCNLRCLFCQNWEISQLLPWETATTPLSPEDVVAAALRSRAEAIAFTYNEPTIFYEYMLDIAKLAKANGLKTLVISCGFIEPEPLRELLPHIDAYKVDFKAFSPEFYTHITSGQRDPILRSMKTIRESGTWLEIVNLLVTDQNDGEEEVRNLARWVKENLGDDVPLHFTRFHPMHKLSNLPAPPIERVIRARQIAIEEGLKYVYTGNIPASPGDTTYSPKTGQPVIERRGYFVMRNTLVNGIAPDGEPIPGIWE